MSTERKRGTGIIKKIFFNKPQPFGYVNFVTPPELRGEEAVFYLKDNLCRPNEMKAFQHRILVDFYYTEKPKNFLQETVPFLAEEMQPLDPAEYSATVVRGPGSGGDELLVCLDLSLRQVSIKKESYDALHLEKTPSVGDSCIVRVNWRAIVNASHGRALPSGDIVALGEQHPKRTEKSVLKPEEPASFIPSPEKNASVGLRKMLKGIQFGPLHEFDAFCRSIAIQLKKMPIRRALICQGKLQKAMINERLAELPSKDIQNDEELLPEQSPSDQYACNQDSEVETDCEN